jgi:hypothetical protein
VVLTPTEGVYEPPKRVIDAVRPRRERIGVDQVVLARHACRLLTRLNRLTAVGRSALTYVSYDLSTLSPGRCLICDKGHRLTSAQAVDGFP